MKFSFDPGTAGARRLARTWLPHLERWDLRVPDHHLFIEGNGRVAGEGEIVDVGAPEGRQLVDSGYELVSIRRAGSGE